MRAIKCNGFGGPEVLEAVEMDDPSPGPGEVLIAVKAAGVNRPDIVQRQGFYPPPPGASDIPGLEVAGEIAALGPGVTGFKEGDKVCALVTGGGYASHCVAPVETVLPIPSGFSWEHAAAIPETYFTVWSNVFERAYLNEGETLLVHGGTSGIGTTAIQLARAFGARVFTTAGSDEKCAFCEGLGANMTVNYKSADFVPMVLNATGGKGVDVVLDMVGGSYVPRNMQVMAVGGRHVSIAFLEGPKVEMNLLPIMLKRLIFTGSTLRARDNGFKGAIAEALFRMVWPLLEDGTVKPVLDHIFPLEEAAAAHRRLESGHAIGKVVLKL